MPSFAPLVPIPFRCRAHNISPNRCAPFAQQMRHLLHLMNGLVPTSVWVNTLCTILSIHCIHHKVRWGRDVSEGGEGGAGPTSLCTKNGATRFSPFVNFVVSLCSRFGLEGGRGVQGAYPLCDISSGRCWGGATPPPPVEYGHSNTSLGWGASDCTIHKPQPQPLHHHLIAGTSSASPKRQPGALTQMARPYAIHMDTDPQPPSRTTATPSVASIAEFALRRIVEGTLGAAPASVIRLLAISAGNWRR